MQTAVILSIPSPQPSNESAYKREDVLPLLLATCTKQGFCFHRLWSTYWLDWITYAK